MEGRYEALTSYSTVDVRSSDTIFDALLHCCCLAVTTAAADGNKSAAAAGPRWIGRRRRRRQQASGHTVLTSSQSVDGTDVVDVVVTTYQSTYGGRPVGHVQRTSFSPSLLRDARYRTIQSEVGRKVSLCGWEWGSSAVLAVIGCDWLTT